MEEQIMARFTLARDLYHGKGSLDELKNLKGKKAIVVVGGGSMKRFGFLDKAVNNLKEQYALLASDGRGTKLNLDTCHCFTLFLLSLYNHWDG